MIQQLSKKGKVVAEFNSVKEASRKTSIVKTNIYRCIRGERNTAGGYKWKNTD